MDSVLFHFQISIDLSFFVVVCFWPHILPSYSLPIKFKYLNQKYE